MAMDPIGIKVNLPDELKEYTDASIGVTSIGCSVALSADTALLWLLTGGETTVRTRWALYTISEGKIDPLESPQPGPTFAAMTQVWTGFTPGTALVQSDNALWVFTLDAHNKLHANKMLDLPKFHVAVRVSTNKVICFVRQHDINLKTTTIYPFPRGSRIPMLLRAWSPATGWFTVCPVDKQAEDLRISSTGNRAAWKEYINHYSPEEGERGEYWGCTIPWEDPHESRAAQLTHGAGRTYTHRLTSNGSGVVFAANFRESLDENVITTHLDLWYSQWPTPLNPKPKPQPLTPGDIHIQYFGLCPTNDDSTQTVWMTILDDLHYRSQTIEFEIGDKIKVKPAKPLKMSVTSEMWWTGSMCDYTGFHAHECHDTLCSLVQITPTGEPLRKIALPQPYIHKFEGFKLEHIRWQTGDDKWVSGIVFEKENETKNKTLLVHVHGGPAAPMPSLKSLMMDCSRYPYRGLIQAGYRVFKPMFRGGVGRGDDWAQSNFQQQGAVEEGGDLNDILTGLDYVLSQFGGDPDRVGMFGGSYGGFMTIRAMSVTTRIAAGVALYGWIHTRLLSLEGGDYTWEGEYVGDPTEWPMTETTVESDNFQHLYKIHKPLLLMHGLKDPLCCPSHTIMTYRLLQEADVPTGLILYPREGHGFVERAHREDRDQRVLAWFLTHLPPV